MDINEVVKAALARAIKVNSTAIDPGDYRLDGTRIIMDLSGVLSKGEAEFHPPTTSVPLIASIALALRLMGVQREQFLEKLEVAMNAALALDEQAEEFVKVFNDDYAATEAKVKSSMRALPPRRHEGKIYPRNVKVDLVINPGPALTASATVTTAP